MIRAAVIGLGRMGSKIDEESSQYTYSRWRPPHSHAACYRAVSGVELVAGADPAGAQREAFAQKWGLSADHVYADYREMLERERPEIVSICTSAAARARILLDVLAISKSVKAIWAEKPIAMTLAEADQMVEGCQRAGVLLAVGGSRCWDPIYNRIRDLIDQGEIGRLLQINAMYPCDLSHNGSHALTLVAYLAGGASGELFARCQWAFGHMEDDARAQGEDDLRGNGYLQFENGVQAFIRSMSAAGAERQIEVIGTDGRLCAIKDGEEVEFWKLAPPDPARRRREPQRQIFPVPLGEATANVRTAQDLLRGLETGKEPNCNGEAGRQALEIAIAMRESHRRGGLRVTLPVEDRLLRMNSRETLNAR